MQGGWHKGDQCVCLCSQVGSLLMDLVALEVQRSEAREAQEGPGTSHAALTAKAAATATAAAAGGRAANRQQQGQQLDQRWAWLWLAVQWLCSCS